MEIFLDAKYDGDYRFGRFRRSSINATKSGVHRIGKLIHERAQEKAPHGVTGQLAQNSHVTRPVYVIASGMATSAVVFEEDYAAFVELGFKGHFVPFHIAPSLYLQAVTMWGWRVPDPGEVPNARSGLVYLIPPGRNRPVWGVFVRGDAQPYLAPAVAEVWDSGIWLRILKEEFELHYREASRGR